MILNMFREQRMKLFYNAYNNSNNNNTTTPVITYKELKNNTEFIPLLDNQPITTNELKIIRNIYTYDPITIHNTTTSSIEQQQPQQNYYNYQQQQYNMNKTKRKRDRRRKMAEIMNSSNLNDNPSMYYYDRTNDTIDRNHNNANCNPNNNCNNNRYNPETAATATTTAMQNMKAKTVRKQNHRQQRQLLSSASLLYSFSLKDVISSLSKNSPLLLVEDDDLREEESKELEEELDVEERIDALPPTTTCVSQNSNDVGIRNNNTNNSSDIGTGVFEWPRPIPYVPTHEQAKEWKIRQDHIQSIKNKRKEKEKEVIANNNDRKKQKEKKKNISKKQKKKNEKVKKNSSSDSKKKRKGITTGNDSNIGNGNSKNIDNITKSSATTKETTDEKKNDTNTITSTTNNSIIENNAKEDNKQDSNDIDTNKKTPPPQSATTSKSSIASSSKVNNHNKRKKGIITKKSSNLSGASGGRKNNHISSQSSSSSSSMTYKTSQSHISQKKSIDKDKSNDYNSNENIKSSRSATISIKDINDNDKEAVQDDDNDDDDVEEEIEEDNTDESDDDDTNVDDDEDDDEEDDDDTEEDKLTLPEYIYSGRGGEGFDDVLSVPSTLGGGSRQQDKNNTILQINTTKTCQIAEQNSVFEGLLGRDLNILENLELYFQLFVFPPSSTDTGRSIPGYSSRVEEIENADRRDKTNAALRIAKSFYPRIQLWPVDRKSRDIQIANSAVGVGAGAAAAADGGNGFIGSNEQLRHVWKDQKVIACGKPAVQRLPPNRIVRYGFHGDVTYLSNGNTETVSEHRKVILCLSNTTVYFILDHDNLTTKAAAAAMAKAAITTSTTTNNANENGNKASAATAQTTTGGGKKVTNKKRKFPLPIEKDAIFQDAMWPHAVACHPLNELQGITIGFGFQRLTLRFTNSTYPSSEDFVYILITSNKMETVKLLTQFQKLAQEVKVGLARVATAVIDDNNDDDIKIDNDDPHVLDELAIAVANATGADSSGMDIQTSMISQAQNLTVLHYQILQQRWKHDNGSRGAVRRVFVLTDTNIYLLDEDYVGDGCCRQGVAIIDYDDYAEEESLLQDPMMQHHIDDSHSYSSQSLPFQQQQSQQIKQQRKSSAQIQQSSQTSVKEQHNEEFHHSRLGEVCFKLVDSAVLQQIEEVRAADADPKAITIMIRPLSRFQRMRRWRLLCHDGQGAETLVDQVRRSMSGVAFTSWF